MASGNVFGVQKTAQVGERRDPEVLTHVHSGGDVRSLGPLNDIVVRSKLDQADRVHTGWNGRGNLSDRIFISKFTNLLIMLFVNLCRRGAENRKKKKKKRLTCFA